MKVINQSILSTKHLLTTNSEEIKFNDDFYRFFILMSGEINPIVNDNPNVYDIEDYAIYFAPEDIGKVEEMDEDGLFNTVLYNGKFYIRNIKDKNEEDILIHAEGDKEIFLTEDALDLMKKGKNIIKFKDLNDDIKLFEMVIMNQELTKSLYDLMDLINKKKSENINESIDVLSQDFLDLLVEAKIDCNVVAAELIINRLIRSIGNRYERPDFTNEDLEPYEIYTVRSALEKNKSPLIGISFQDIKRQFISDELFEDRNSTSYVDNFYKKEIHTDNLKNYAKMVSRKKLSSLISK